MGIWRTHYTSQVYRSLHWVLSGLHFSKVYVLAKMRAFAMVLLLGSAEGHGVPRKLIYASVLMHEMCYATEKMRIGPSDSHYRM